MTYTYSIDQVFINVFTESGALQAEPHGMNYPYIYPGKEIDDKIPTINIDGFPTIDGGPVPLVVRRADPHVADTATWVKGRHTMKAGVAVEYSGEDDFDQINVNAIPGGTNNQNGQFDFRDGRAGGTGLGIADMALGLFTNYAEIGERDYTEWRPLATDIFVQDSWKPNDEAHGRRRLPLRDLAAVVLQRRTTSPTSTRASTTRANEAVINPSTGRIISGPRYNGIVLPGDGFVGDGNDSDGRERPGRAGALPRRAARLLRRRTTTCSSRGWACPTR